MKRIPLGQIPVADRNSATLFLNLSRYRSASFENLLMTMNFRLGFVIEFLSHAAIVGFMAGAAITIALQQLKGLLGIAKFTTDTDIISVMKSVWKAVHHGVRRLRKTLFFLPLFSVLIPLANPLSGTGRRYLSVSPA